MTNLEKMNQLVNSNATKEKITNWAYANRICVGDLPYEEEFNSMKNSFEMFLESKFYIDNSDDEFKLWREFLDRKFVEQ